MKEARQRTFGFVNWGGKRRGAGRKPKGERAGVAHVRRPRLAARYPVMVTMRLRAGLRSLREREAHALLARAFALGSGESFRVVEYSVQSNHLHLIVEAEGERALARGMTGLAVRVARGLNRLWRRAGSVLADRYHARILRSPREVRAALVYVLRNAHKHGAWRALAPDPSSSARWFDGWRGRATKCADSRPGVLARARTWLLSVGWRKRELLDLRELPVGGWMRTPVAANGRSS